MNSRKLPLMPNVEPHLWRTLLRWCAKQEANDRWPLVILASPTPLQICLVGVPAASTRALRGIETFTVCIGLDTCESSEVTMTSTASPKRWAIISASANAEAEYRTVYDDQSTAHDCDGGISCLCQKLASQPYGHPWIVSRAGYRKFLTQHLHSYLRNPDFFDMYTFNDHYGYGQLEMMQNLLLDFADADPLWREQWAIVEGAVLWLLDVESTPMLQIGTGHDLVDIFDLIGRMFVAMVARLERENLLSEIPSLGAVMSMFVGLFTRLRRFDIVEKTRKITGASDYDARRLASYVLAYSKQYKITLTSHVDSEAYQGDWGEIKLPTSTMNKNDPWGFFRRGQEIPQKPLQRNGLLLLWFRRDWWRCSRHHDLEKR
ncbi:hypothetical protein BB8028_0007g00390 [Beauveria bassiana]|uniref:Uncharacterized protein n=1 Tax=Beauveria bassiana TaxID=176275 RepID=A0A2S7YKY2_BEABA|nr:hypothetical protein BB8028_0007g00390 [Beauveria bassiana]